MIDTPASTYTDLTCHKQLYIDIHLNIHEYTSLSLALIGDAWLPGSGFEWEHQFLCIRFPIWKKRNSISLARCTQMNICEILVSWELALRRSIVCLLVTTESLFWLLGRFPTHGMQRPHRKGISSVLAPRVLLCTIFYKPYLSCSLWHYPPSISGLPHSYLNQSLIDDLWV